MKASLKIDGAIVTVDLSTNFDLSIPIRASTEFPLSQDQPASAEAVEDLDLNKALGAMHTNGTRTECIGRVSEEFYSINQVLKDYVFCAEVISVVPENFGEEYRISKKQLMRALKELKPTAVIIRTLPNTNNKRTRDYAGAGWAYLEDSAAAYLAEIGVKHLLVDLPSIDKDRLQTDQSVYKAFWQYPENPRTDCTITELVYVPNEVEDGSYLLNLLVAPIESIASPSKPILHPFLRRA